MSHSGFPFQEYLSNLLNIPLDSITIEPLNGGLTNETSRVIFELETPLRFPGSPPVTIKSAIVKHAPPYIAYVGPSHALSTKRQVVEAQSLRMFSDPDLQGMGVFGPSHLHMRTAHPHIRVPEVLFHDEKQHVLVISDLGRIPTLSAFLKSKSLKWEVTERAAMRLGVFLADLHHHTLGTQIPDNLFLPFDNPQSTQAIRELVGTLPGKLLHLHNVADAEELGRRVEEDMATVTDRVEERCFGMVDLWPGNILIGDDVVGLVDWEYAGKSCAGNELGMLTAHLRIPLFSSTTSTEYSDNIRAFTKELLTAYAQRTRSLALLPPNFTRSVLLSHGHELINAVEFHSDEYDIDAAHAVSLIHSGGRCLRAAGPRYGELLEVCEILDKGEIEFLRAILFGCEL